MRGATGRLRRARAWQRSGLLDRGFYGALRGRRFRSDLLAALDLVEHGMPRRLSPHPLLDLLSLPDPVEQSYRRGDVDAVLAHLATGAGAPGPVGPLAAVADEIVGLRAHLVDVAERLGVASATARTRARPVLHGAATAMPPRQPGLTSVVVGASTRRGIRAVRSILDQADRADRADGPVEVVLVDRGWPPLVELGVHAWATARCGAPPVETPEGWSWADGTMRLLPARRSPGDDRDWATRAAATVRGDVVVVLDGGLLARSGWLAEIRAALAEPGAEVVQPLLLGPDDMIVAAGTSGPPARDPLLRGHPKEDALRWAGRAVPGLDARARAFPADTTPPLDPSGDSPEGSSGWRVAPGALLSAPDAAPAPSRWQPGAGSLVGLGPNGPRNERASAQGDLHPHLRWSLNLPSPPGAFGDTWGDTHYAEALARALRRRDQDVVTRRRGAHASGPVELDHVALALRGRVPVPPVEGRCNVLWVISHPEDVEPEELEPFDVVCAASTVWSAEMSRRSGREVVPLHQATEFTRAEPAASDEAVGVVFVGTNLGRDRPLVWQALAAGVPLHVYGPGWEGLPPGVWRGEHVANHRLPGLYRSHGIVLADHWSDMARHGFVANRVFDAVACGARVIADDVRGIHDVFDPDEVSVARDAADVRRLVEDLRRRPRTARHRPELSFDDRSATLLDLVSARLGA